MAEHRRRDRSEATVKYRKLTRKEAKQLFELGAPVESRHYNTRGETEFADSQWSDVRETAKNPSIVLSPTVGWRDYYRIAVE